jgi:hypothetical protein
MDQNEKIMATTSQKTKPQATILGTREPRKRTSLDSCHLKEE